jgi:hypothetical protein
MAGQPNSPRPVTPPQTELICEIAPPVPTGRSVIEGQDYSTTLHLLAQLAAVRPVGSKATATPPASKATATPPASKAK